MATLQMNKQSRVAARTYLPKDFDRIDDLVSGQVGLVVTPGTPRPLTNELMFWNRSIGDPIAFPGSGPVDGFGQRSATIAADGRLLVDKKPWRGPLLVSDYASHVQLRGALRLLAGLTSDLWQPQAEARFALMTSGLYFDGWLTLGNSTTVWPDARGRLRGTLEIELKPPSGLGSARIKVKTPWGGYRVKLAPGHSSKVYVRLHGNRPANIIVGSNRIGHLNDGRFVIAKARFRLVEKRT